MDILTLWGIFDVQKIEPKLVEFPPMYALAKNGNVRTYKVAVEDKGSYAVLSTTKSVTIGGKDTVDLYEYHEGVNIGKANETTYLQQAVATALSTIKNLQDKGFTTELPKKGVKFNTDAQGKIKPQLAISFREDKVELPCICQPKYDGVRCTISESVSDIDIISRNGKPYKIPHLEEWAKENRHLLPLDGELYNHKELTFQEIISAVKKVSAITSKITYIVYDKPIAEVPNYKRWEELQVDLGGQKGCVKLSGARVCFTLEEVYKYHDECVAEGYEGIIIRNMNGKYEFGFRSSNLIKLKKFDTDEFEIVDVLEATGRDSGTAVFECKDSTGTFTVKPQGTRELRGEYFRKGKKLVGKKLTVQYQGLTDDGHPRFPSAITIRDYE